MRKDYSWQISKADFDYVEPVDVDPSNIDSYGNVSPRVNSVTKGIGGLLVAGAIYGTATPVGAQEVG